VTVPVEEPSHTESNLDRINPRIRESQSRVRDVQVAQFHAPVIFRAEDVCAQRGGGREVHGVGVGGDVVVSEEGASAEFEVGREAAAANEIPLEAERVESQAVGSIGGLEDEKHGNGIHGVFETSAKKAGEMRAGDDPSVAQAGVEDAGVAASAADGVAAAGPELHFMPVFLGAGLFRARTPQARLPGAGLPQTDG